MGMIFQINNMAKLMEILLSEKIAKIEIASFPRWKSFALESKKTLIVSLDKFWRNMVFWNDFEILFCVIVWKNLWMSAKISITIFQTNVFC